MCDRKNKNQQVNKLLRLRNIKNLNIQHINRVGIYLGLIF